jgi:hypothetical protein
MSARQVTARFADTLLMAVRVEPGHELRIGTAPDVDLAVPGLGRFPLVGADGLILIPAGAAATYVCNGTRVPVADRSVRLGPGARLELVLGLVAIQIELAAVVPVIAQPRGDRRVLPYAAGALLAHGAFMLAVFAAPPPTPPAPLLETLRSARLAKTMPHTPLTQPVPPPESRARAQHLAHAKQPLPAIPQAATPEPVPTVEMAGPNTVVAHRAAARADGAEHAHAATLGSAIAALWGPDWSEAVKGWDPLYNEGDHAGEQFGGAGGRFDPTTNPAFASIAAGNYHTHKVTGAAELQLCAGHSCQAQGAIDSASVTSWIAPHTDDLRACIEREPGQQDGRILVAFTIDGSGAARGVHARALGQNVGGCVAAVVASISFPRTDHATTVTYPITFTRAEG